MVSDEQWLKNIEQTLPYTPRVDNKRKKLPTPKTHYKIIKKKI